MIKPFVHQTCVYFLREFWTMMVTFVVLIDFEWNISISVCFVVPDLRSLLGKSHNMVPSLSKLVSVKNPPNKNDPYETFKFKRISIFFAKPISVPFNFLPSDSTSTQLRYYVSSFQNCKSFFSNSCSNTLPCSSTLSRSF